MDRVKIAAELVKLAKEVVADGPRDMLADFDRAMKLFWKQIKPVVAKELKGAGVQPRASILRPDVMGKGLVSALFVDIKDGKRKDSYRLNVGYRPDTGQLLLYTGFGGAPRTSDVVKMLKGIDTLDDLVDAASKFRSDAQSDAAKKVAQIEEYREVLRQREEERERELEEYRAEREREEQKKEGIIPRAERQTYADNLIGLVFKELGRKYKAVKTQWSKGSRTNGTIYLETPNPEHGSWFYVSLFVYSFGLDVQVQISAPMMDYGRSENLDLTGNVRKDASMIVKNVTTRVGNA